ncbi:MAG: hypothetical protein ACRDRH_12405 [Pseudonocardia sp.]
MSSTNGRAQDPRIRRASLPDDALIVVRGDDLDPAASRHQADVFRRRFPDWGRWGLSAFYARSDAEIEDLAAPASRFRTAPVSADTVAPPCESMSARTVSSRRNPAKRAVWTHENGRGPGGTHVKPDRAV